jgi:aldose 1-epimerase
MILMPEQGSNFINHCDKEVPLVCTIEKSSFGVTAQGIAVDRYTLTNSGGMSASIITLGGTVTALKTKDRDGKLDDIVLGHDSVEGYEKASPFFGCVVGRFGNRIAKGRFTLDNETYRLACNNGENHLHGGLKGFDKVVWNAETKITDAGAALALLYLSRDGEEGYPGNLNVTMTYTLTDKDELRIDYAASTDKTTVVNLTHHGYFNLNGAGLGDILDHQLEIDADRFTPVDNTAIPTGELRSVKGTPMDFTNKARIGDRIDANDEQIAVGGGYDHNFVLNKKSDALSFAAGASSSKSGRTMEVHTTEPGVQLYTGNFLDGSIIGKGGAAYKKRYGFCLETQHYPDSPNKPDFPSTVLRPGEIYKSVTVYRFGVL